MPMSGHEQYYDDLAAYALDALPPREAQAFEGHLETCGDCRDVLRDLRRVSAAIGVSTEPVTPPTTLRAVTLARAIGQRRETDRASAPIATPPISARSRPRHAPSMWLPVAASLLCAVALGTYGWGQRSQLITTRQLLADMSIRAESLRAQLAAARLDSTTLANTINILRSPGFLRVDLRGPSTTASDASARAFFSEGRGLVFDADHLPRLPDDRTYQLWVITPGTPDPISAGTFTVDDEGTAILAIPLPQGVGLIAAVAVSDEPRGGSPKPTSSPLLVGSVAN